MLQSEAVYQDRLIKKLRQVFPGVFILKPDSEEFQGIPDLLILFGTHYAFLEVKLSPKSRVQANQMHYIELFNEMSYASFICPDTEDQVIKEMEYSFGLEW